MCRLIERADDSILRQIDFPFRTVSALALIRNPEIDLDDLAPVTKRAADIGHSNAIIGRAAARDPESGQIAHVVVVVRLGDVVGGIDHHSEMPGPGDTAWNGERGGTVDRGAAVDRGEAIAVADLTIDASANRAGDLVLRQIELPFRAVSTLGVI